jgi:phosphatidylglycerophosphate synthase
MVVMTLGAPLVTETNLEPKPAASIIARMGYAAAAISMPLDDVQRWIGVVVVPADLAPRSRIGGLEPRLRAALALQAAGVSAIYIVGPGAALFTDARLRAPMTLDAPDDALDDAALVVSAGGTQHRLLATRLATMEARGGTLLRAGEGEGAVYVAGQGRVAEVIEALTAGHEPVDATAAPLLEGEFTLPARTADERRVATTAHLRSLRKPTGGVLENLYMRPLSMRMTRVLCNTPVTPNAMSILTLLMAFVAAGMVAMPSAAWQVAGGALHIFMRVVDCVDGELARLRYQTSRFGEWLDSVGDGIGIAALFVGITVSVTRYEPEYLPVGVVAVLAWTAVQLLQYRAAALTGGSGSFHKIEWGHRAKERTPLEAFVGHIEMALRIDSLSTIYGVVIIFGLLRALLVAQAVLVSGAAVYFAAQVHKLARRRAAPAN